MEKKKSVKAQEEIWRAEKGYDDAELVKCTDGDFILFLRQDESVSIVLDREDLSRLYQALTSEGFW